MGLKRALTALRRPPSPLGRAVPCRWSRRGRGGGGASAGGSLLGPASCRRHAPPSWVPGTPPKNQPPWPLQAPEHRTVTQAAVRGHSRSRGPLGHSAAGGRSLCASHCRGLRAEGVTKGGFLPGLWVCFSSSSLARPPGPLCIPRTPRVQGPGLRWEDIIVVAWPSLPAQASGPELGGALTQLPGPRTNPAGPAARPTSRRPGRPLSWEPSAPRLHPGGHGHVHTPTLGFTAASEQAAAASLG